MDAPSLTPGGSRELADLRRRAYGPDADIQRDPDAVARLHELEALSRDQSPAPEPASIERVSPTPRAAAAGAVRGEGSAPPSTAERATDGPVNQGEPPEGGAASDSTVAKRPWWRRIPVWGVAAVSLIAGVVIAVGGLWIGSQSAPTDGPDLTLARSAGGERGPGFAQNLDYWGVDRGSLKPYETFDSIGVWTARGSEESRCLLLSYEGQIFTGACIGGGLDPVLDMTVHRDMPVKYERALPVGSVVRFVATDEGIDVWVRPVGIDLSDFLS